MKNKIGLHFLLCLLLFSGVSTLSARQPIKPPAKPPVKVNEIQVLTNKLDAFEALSLPTSIK